MGGNVSKDKSRTDVMNEFVTSVVTNVTNSKKTVVEINQKMDIGCSDDAFKQALEMCTSAKNQQSADKREMIKAYLAAGKEPSDALIKSFDTKPPACEACTVEDVGQASVVTISMQDINDNSIAGKIQSDLMSKLDAAKTTMQNEGFSKNEVINEAVSSINNKIKSDVTTNVINQSLSSFVTNQEMKIGNNMGARKVSQSAIVNFVSASLIENIVEGDASVKAAVETLIPVTNTQKSIASNTTDMVGSVANNAISTIGGVVNKAVGTVGELAQMWIIFVVIGFVIFAYLASKVLGGSNGQALMQMAQGQLSNQMPGMQQYQQPYQQYQQPYQQYQQYPQYQQQ